MRTTVELDADLLREAEQKARELGKSLDALLEAALRDGPLPRVTGPVYAVMGDAPKELVRTVGVSGLNTVKDGKTLTPHNPHNTLVYSMAKFTPEIQAAFDQAAKEFNQILPEGIPTTFKTVSIVELGFAGNVLREIYRVDLSNGSVVDIATGQR